MPNFVPLNFSFTARKRTKSHGAKSSEYGGFREKSPLFLSSCVSKCVVMVPEGPPQLTSRELVLPGIDNFQLLNRGL